MDLFVFSTVSGKGQEQLKESLKTFFPKRKVKICQTFEKLSQRLKLPAELGSIVVLAPGSREDLLRILSKRDLLRGLRTVVIAPDHEVETTGIAYQLRPRYLTYLNGNFGDLAAVLHKMVAGHPSDEALSWSHSDG